MRMLAQREELKEKHEKIEERDKKIYMKIILSAFGPKRQE